VIVRATKLNGLQIRPPLQKARALSRSVPLLSLEERSRQNLETWSEPADNSIALLSRQLSPGEAVARGSVRLEGDEAALERFVEIFAWPSPETFAAAV